MRKAIILFNLGGPDSLNNVEPFLFNLFNDPAILNLPSFLRFPLAKLISKRRTPTAKKIYQQLGGSSPILKLTEKQSKALETKLNNDDDNSEYKSFVVMRCWHPRAEDEEMVTTAPSSISFAADSPLKTGTFSPALEVTDLVIALHHLLKPQH